MAVEILWRWRIETGFGVPARNYGSIWSVSGNLRGFDPPEGRILRLWRRKLAFGWLF
jgi:hypothetical protein